MNAKYLAKRTTKDGKIRYLYSRSLQGPCPCGNPKGTLTANNGYICDHCKAVDKHNGMHNVAAECHNTHDAWKPYTTPFKVCSKLEHFIDNDPWNWSCNQTNRPSC